MKSEIEDFGFGPGYMLCGRDYIDRSDNSLLLDAVSESLQLPRDRIVPVMAGSCDVGGYLEAPKGALQILQVVERLDFVVFDTVQNAKAFRREAPVLFPLSVTRDAISKAACGVLRSDFVRGPEVLDKFEREREELDILFECGFNIDPSQLSMHLGADEGLKALFRFLAEEGRADSVHMPFPNYFDAIDFAAQYGFKIFPLGNDPYSLSMAVRDLDSDSRPIVYVSNPNNPLGWTLKPNDVASLRYMLPEEGTLIVDTTNINLEWLPMGAFRESIVDKVGGARTFAVSSSSKRYNGVISRFGWVYGPKGEMEGMQKLQSPCFAEDVQVLDMDVWEGTMQRIHDFKRRLSEVVVGSYGQVRASDSNSNFMTVTFVDPARKDDFMRRMAELDPARANTHSIVALPLSGAGELELNEDGSVDVEASGPGIIGLGENVVRLNALNHPVVLDVLEEALH